MAHHNNIGKTGELLAQRFLKQKGFVITQSNFRFKNLGEIDIIAKKGIYTYFIEVKTVSNENSLSLSINPEENVTREKLRKLKNIISFYLESFQVQDWKFSVVAVFVDEITKKAKIRFIEDEILPE